MKTMYYAYYLLNRIEEVQVESETEHFIKIIGRGGRDKRSNDSGSYHDTKSDAVQALKDDIQSKIDQYERQIKYRQSEMNDVIKLYGE